MAHRPVFVPSPDGCLVEERTVEFKWFSGIAVSQKRRSIESLHHSAACHLGLAPTLEVSTKSANPFGVRLSAFNLSVEISARAGPILLEAAFQGSKVFATRGPFTHLLSMRSGREVKRYMKQFSNDQLVGFRFDGRDWELTPKTAFYDWLYIGALRRLADRSGEIDDVLVKFDAFTDIEFNPEKSVNCQARSCALYVALLKGGNLRAATTDPTSFVKILNRRGYGLDSVLGFVVEG